LNENKGGTIRPFQARPATARGREKNSKNPPGNERKQRYSATIKMLPYCLVKQSALELREREREREFQTLSGNERKKMLRNN
jgi:hypothetical protein